MNGVYPSWIGRQPRLDLIVGPMFSGKTSELMRRVKRYQLGKVDVRIFKPIIDDRSVGEIKSHDDDSMPAIEIAKPEQILTIILDHASARVIAIDEAHFFDKTQKGLLNVCRELMRRGFLVMVAGLDRDSAKGEPMPHMCFLMGDANHVLKCSAVCMLCTRDATHTFRRQESTGKLVMGKGTSGQAVVGGIEEYGACCLDCFVPDTG